MRGAEKAVPPAAVVFDFDGTLVDTNHLKREGFLGIAARFPAGREVMARVHASTTGDRWRVFEVFAAEMREEAGLDIDPAALAVEYTAEVDGRVAAAPEIEGATRLLGALGELGVPAFLSSATPLSSLGPIVAARGWRRFFHDMFGAPATKEETIGIVASRLAVAPARLVVVGDGADDRRSALATGARFIAVGEGRGCGPGEAVHRLDEILALLTPLCEQAGRGSRHQ
jgi:beta-phosphoglucomutase-like phosphatase (HAD superfamily)